MDDKHAETRYKNYEIIIQIKELFPSLGYEVGGFLLVSFFGSYQFFFSGLATSLFLESHYRANRKFHRKTGVRLLHLLGLDQNSDLPQIPTETFIFPS